jgi:hypothetical protein
MLTHTGEMMSDQEKAGEAQKERRVGHEAARYARGFVAGTVDAETAAGWFRANGYTEEEANDLVAAEGRALAGRVAPRQLRFPKQAPPQAPETGG